jgi:hypothetical protein
MTRSTRREPKDKDKNGRDNRNDDGNNGRKKRK